MGLFDRLRCQYPLPGAGANDSEYQTKSLECAMDNLEIRADGTLWLEEYDVENRSDPNAKGLMRIVGMLTRVNKRWVPLNYTGEVRFYAEHEFSAYFVDGRLKMLTPINQQEPKP